MKAIVLAGGCGTRLRPLTYTMPKPMLPLLDKPVLERIVERLATQGFDEIVVTTNYLREQVINHFRDGGAFGVEMVYPREEVALGTAGSVKNAEERLDETFAVVQGDGVTDISIEGVMRFHEERRGIATLALTTLDDPSEYGVVELDSKARIVRFREKPGAEERFSNLINTGIYILEPEALKFIPKGRVFDFAKNLFPRLISAGKMLFGYQASGFWVDIGRPEKYMEAVHWALAERKRRISETEAPSSYLTLGLHRSDDVEIDSAARVDGLAVLGDGCRIGRGAVVEGYSVIERDVIVSEGARIRDSVVYEGSGIGRCSLIDNSIVAEKCRISSHVEMEAAVVGAGCRIGDNAILHPGSRIWPKIDVNANASIRGVIK